MPPEAINRETVARRRDRLLAEYDDVTVREYTDELPNEAFAGFREHCRDGYTGGAYAWVVREPEQAAALTESMPEDVETGERALMVLNRADRRWGLAGGGREAEETFEDAAVREVREETGIECRIEDCFLVRDVVVTSSAHDDRVHVLQVFFDAAYDGGHIEVQPGELNGAAWFAHPPDPDRLQPANVYRAAEFWDEFEADGDPLETVFA